MTLTSSEDKNTGGLVVDGVAQTQTLTRSFTVVDTLFDPAAPKNEREAAIATGVSIGSPHPNFPNSSATKYSVRREPDNPSVFRVQFTYDIPAIDTGGGGPDGPPDIEPYRQQVNMNFSAKFEKLWRIGANPSASPWEGDGTNAADIGGDPTDTWGEIERPFLIVKPQVQVTMRRNVRTTGSVNYLTTLASFVGTRNKSVFLGAAQGNLLYLGATSRRLTDVGRGDLYEITHNFEYDNFKHQQQITVPGQGVFGRSVGGADAGVDAKYRNRAFPVHWVQPYKTEMNFNALGIDIS
tara:strand:+ start:1292 stop:2176 length:885 start_codon:yes stop_codon:yes gene_type:complete